MQKKPCLILVALFYGIGMVYPWAFLADKASAVDIATIHTGFNIAATAVLMPLNRLLVKLAILSVPDDKEDEKIVLLDERLLATPAVAIQRSREIAAEMARDTAEAMKLAMGLMEAHEYLNALKAGELHESDAYAERFARYKAQYAFPEENANESGYPLPHRETGAADFCSGK